MISEGSQLTFSELLIRTSYEKLSSSNSNRMFVNNVFKMLAQKRCFLTLFFLKSFFFLNVIACF